MNILFINNFFVGFMVSEIPRVSVFGHCPFSVTFRIRLLSLYIYIYIYYFISPIYIDILLKIKCIKIKNLLL